MYNVHVHKFRITGDTGNRYSVEMTVKAVLDLMVVPIQMITGFRIDEVGHLVFCIDGQDAQTRYPFTPTIRMLCDHIIDYITSIDESNLSKFGEELTGYEEDYSIGYELFLNDYTSEHHRIVDKSYYDVFAVKPIVIEEGK